MVVQPCASASSASSWRTLLSISSRIGRTASSRDLRVGEVPVQVALAGVDRAGVTAAHSDHDIGGLHLAGGQWLGELAGDVEADSAMAWTAGLSRAAGWEPAEATRTRPAAWWSSRAAIWKRPAWGFRRTALRGCRPWVAFWVSPRAWRAPRRGPGRAGSGRRSRPGRCRSPPGEPGGDERGCRGGAIPA
jgi:hypothetical protein